MPFAVGERIGDYEVAKVLGAGGMGEVYQVRHTISDRVEAMKVLLPNLEKDSELADRFLREIKVQASLTHPNIAALYTAVKHGNSLVMLMEFLDGSSIDQLLRSGPMPYRLGMRYVAQVLDALAYAHSRGVVHRDIKPANIMVTSGDNVKLMDFGIARLKQDRKLTNTGQTVGSLYYMSPEQIKGEELDSRSDLYSVGVTLYEAVTGKRPFEGTSDYSIMAAHLQQTPVPPIQVDPTLPPRLNEIILTAIAKDKQNRFQKAEAFATALRNVLAELDGPPPAVTVAAGEPAAAASRPAWPRYLAVAAALLFVGLGASQIPKMRTAQPESVQAPPPLPKPEPKPAVPVKPEPVAPPASEQPVLRKRNLPEPVPPVEAQQQQPPTAPPPEAPKAAAPTPTADDGQLEKLEDRSMKLGARLAVVHAKARSIEQQQAALGVGLRGDVKTNLNLASVHMDEAERHLRSRNAAKAAASLDKAEYLIDKLEEILGH